MLHPLVDSHSNNLNLDYEFKEWVAGKHWVINVLMYIKKLFHVEAMYNLGPDSGVESYNKDALNMYQKDFSKYVRLCKQCVEKS